MSEETRDEYQVGMTIRRAVLGNGHVDKALAGVNDFNEPLQRLITEYCWGAVWSRPDLDLTTRSLINLGVLTALNRPEELRLHIRGALNNGCTNEMIRETLLQTAIYCGVPAALEAFKHAEAVIHEYNSDHGK